LHSCSQHCFQIKNGNNIPSAASTAKNIKDNAIIKREFACNNKNGDSASLSVCVHQDGKK
jgi:hypothetical protein